MASNVRHDRSVTKLRDRTLCTGALPVHSGQSCPIRGITMLKTVITALVLSTAIAVCAISAKAEVTPQSPANEFVSYSTALTACGIKWRAREDKDTVKGMDAWQAFRATCVQEAGFRKGTKRPK